MKAHLIIAVFFWGAVGGLIMVWPALIGVVPVWAFVLGGVGLSASYALAKYLKRPGTQ